MFEMTLLNETNYCMSTANIIKWVCLGATYSIISSIIDIIFILQIFRIKREDSKLLFCLLALSLAKFITSLIFFGSHYKIVEMILLFALFKYGLKQTFEKSMLAETLNIAIISSIEIIFAKFLLLIFGNVDGYIAGLTIFGYNLSLKILTIIFRLIIIYFSYKKDFKISFSDYLQVENKRSTIIDSIFGITIVILNELELIHGINFISYCECLLNITLYFYICWRNMIRINLLEKQALKIHTLEAYNKTLSLMYNKIRGFKHDFSNFVLALDGYVETENINGIRQMSKSILNECRVVNKMELLDPSIINNPAIYSIITSKYYLAKEQNLNMNIEILSKIGSNENSYAICRILGILLDNAIEAAKDSKDKILNVRFIEDSKNRRKLIIIENSYENKNVDIDKIFEQGYTSKESNSEEHGLGLWNIKNILMNNENLNLFTTADDLFRQQLEIY